MSEIAREAAESLWTGLGRRDFVRAVAALSAGAGVAGVASACSPGGSTSTPSAVCWRWSWAGCLCPVRR